MEKVKMQESQVKRSLEDKKIVSDIELLVEAKRYEQLAEGQEQFLRSQNEQLSKIVLVVYSIFKNTLYTRVKEMQRNQVTFEKRRMVEHLVEMKAFNSHVHASTREENQRLRMQDMLRYFLAFIQCCQSYGGK